MIFSDAAEEDIRPAIQPGLAVSYWVGELPLEGAADFQSTLKAAYDEVTVEEDQGGLGGGLYTLFVEIGALVSLPHFVQLILDGIAFDLIKLGTNRLVLQPLLAAQQKLTKRKNIHSNDGDFAYLCIRFLDSEIILDADSRVHQSIADSLGSVLLLIAKNYERLSLSDGRSPIQIYAPLIEDTGSNRISRFRAVLEVDEEMSIGDKVFYEYWGLRYSNGERRIFDVQRSLLIDERFIYRREYWRQQDFLTKR